MNTIILGLIMMVLGVGVYNLEPFVRDEITIPAVRILMFGGSAVIVVGFIKLFL